MRNWIVLRRGRRPRRPVQIRLRCAPFSGEIAPHPVGRDAHIAPRRTGENSAPLSGECLPYHRFVFSLLFRMKADRLKPRHKSNIGHTMRKCFYLGKNACSFRLTLRGLAESCVAAIGAMRFSCAAPSAHFLFL